MLRKKNKQISFLHLYHHTMMPICAFIGVTFLPGIFNYFLLVSSFLSNLLNRRPWNAFGYYQFLHPRRHVHVLPYCFSWTSVSKISVVEEIPYFNADGKFLANFMSCFNMSFFKI